MCNHTHSFEPADWQRFLYKPPAGVHCVQLMQPPNQPRSGRETIRVGLRLTPPELNRCARCIVCSAYCIIKASALHTDQRRGWAVLWKRVLIYGALAKDAHPNWYKSLSFFFIPLPLWCATGREQWKPIERLKFGKIEPNRWYVLLWVRPRVAGTKERSHTRFAVAADGHMWCRLKWMTTQITIDSCWNLYSSSRKEFHICCQFMCQFHMLSLSPVVQY